MKLARKLSLTLFCGVFVVIATFGYVRVKREIALFDNDMRRDHRLVAATLRSAMLEIWELEGESRALALVRRADAEKQGVKIRWVSMQPAPTLPEAAFAMASLRSAVSSSTPTQVEVSAPALGEGEYLVTYQPVLVRGRAGAIELSESLSQKSEYIRTTIATTAIATLAIAVVSGIVALAIGRWLVGEPISRLIAKARRVGAGDLSNPLTLRQADEFQELAREFNAMCERLANAREHLERETSARIRTLEQLRHADRLTTIGQLMSSIAHEIGTPLNVVSGHANLIARQRVSGSDVQASADVIVEQCGRMTRIVRQVLDYGRRREPRKARVDLLDVVRSTVALLMPLAQKRQIALELENDAPEQRLVEIDASQVQQALTNVLVNAIQASFPLRPVRIRISETLRDADSSSDTTTYLAIEVIDKGPGMTDETARRLFEPFFTTKEVGQGTGLGLSIADEIVREHRGFISVESSPGEGSRFSIHLPRGAVS